MIVIAKSLILASATGVNLSAPVILWDNILRAEMLSHTGAASSSGYPVTNLANDSTVEGWRSTGSGTQTILMEGLGAEVDSIGVARHNFGSAQIGVTVQAQTGGNWFDVVEEFLPASDRPMLLRFEPMIYEALRLRLRPTSTPPRAAVLYVGKALIMPHGITAPHAPLDQSRETHVVTGTSESGEYLGRIITGQSSQTQARFDLLTIPWYYEHFAPFIQRGASGPFFFAWLPRTRPLDVGYAWLRTDPVPSMGSIYMDVTLDIGGIAR